jgi:hypothetical protein
MKKSKKVNTTRLSDIEWTTCWMALRYAMNRQTIASVTLPGDLIKAYYYRWTHGQKQMIIKDLNQNDLITYVGSGGKVTAFGSPTIDRIHWIKFWKCLDEKKHSKVLLNDNTEIVVFKAEGVYYSLEKYLESPTLHWTIEEENIKKWIKRSE